MNKRYLNIDEWSRKEHFHFFRQYDEPFWGITSEVDVQIAFDLCKKEGHSFFLYYLHASVSAVNQIESFKYRIDDQNRVEIHDVIHASATVNRDDGSFGFTQITYDDKFEAFVKNANLEIERVRSTTSLFPPVNDVNVVHYSSVPWIHFTSLSHARNFKNKEGTPKISFGKALQKEGKLMMPVSVHVHHALMDGFHVAAYLDAFQQILNR